MWKKKVLKKLNEKITYTVFKEIRIMWYIKVNYCDRYKKKKKKSKEKKETLDNYKMIRLIYLSYNCYFKNNIFFYIRNAY